MEIITIITISLVGLAIGSFLNVVIYRLPLKISLIKERSFCPKCNKPIKWYENIPLISFIILKGRCSGCKEKVSLRYPLVEFITLVLVLLTYFQFGLTLYFFTSSILMFILIIGSFIDIDHLYIPDRVPIMICLLAMINITYQFINANYQIDILLIHLYGLLFGFISFYLIRLISGLVYKTETFGLGDVKLYASLGLYLGLSQIILSFFLIFVVTAIILVFLLAIKLIKREDKVPFGPFISLGAIISLLYGTYLISLYLNLL